MSASSDTDGLKSPFRVVFVVLALIEKLMNCLLTMLPIPDPHHRPQPTAALSDQLQPEYRPILSV
jgi:hypothetical protein